MDFVMCQLQCNSSPFTVYLLKPLVLGRGITAILFKGYAQKYTVYFWIGFDRVFSISRDSSETTGCKKVIHFVDDIDNEECNFTISYPEESFWEKWR